MRIYDGEHNPNSKLTEQEVKLIFAYREQGVTVKELAKYFGVSVPLIYKILSGERWKGVVNAK